MRTLIIILIIAAFLQSTIIPLDLVLLILICRTYLRSGTNLYLGFSFGLLVSLLNLSPLGLQSLFYLIFIQATESLSKLRLAGNPLLIIPISFLFLFLNQLILSIINQSIVDWLRILLAAVLSLPILYLLRLWEERFVVRKEIKLKI